jgi:hypothetical protein
MRIIKEPPNPQDWYSQINCQCGAILGAEVGDIRTKTVAKRFGMTDVIFYAVCPFCNRQHTIPDIPQYVIEAVNRRTT